MINCDDGKDGSLSDMMDRIRKGCDKFGIYPSLLWYRFSLNDDSSLKDFSFGLVEKSEFVKLYSSAKCEFPGLSIDPDKDEDVDRVWADQAEKLKHLRDFLAQDPQ